MEKRDPGSEHAGEGYCDNPTDGGRCRMHGRDAGAPIKHGLYSFKREKLRKRFENAEAADMPGDLWTEVAVLRALLSDYLEDLEETDDNAVTGAKKLVGELRKTVSTIHEMRMRQTLTERETSEIMDGLGSILRRHVPEEEREQALDELNALSKSVIGG